MNKKNIYFLADAPINLFDLHENLKNFYKIYWVVYNEDVVNELKNRNVKNIIYIDNLSFINFLGKKNMIYKIFRLFISKFFNKIERNALLTKIKKIEDINKPDFWITDTGSVLSKVKTSSPKCTFKHSVCYKNYYLNENIFDYDHVFLPGNYHYNRIVKFWKDKVNNQEFDKLIVAGSLKISPYVKKKNLNEVEKEKLLNKLNLSKDRKTVLFAPSHDAHGYRSGLFLPKKFGNQFESLRKISKFITEELNYNFILKLHHFHFNLLKNSEIRKIEEEKNNYVFKKAKYIDTEASENLIRLSDVIISDISGVAPIGAFLKKKIIFLEPGPFFDWQKCDMEPHYRPGFICENFIDLTLALKKYGSSENFFIREKEKFVNEIFFKHEVDAIENISKSLQKIIN